MQGLGRFWPKDAGLTVLAIRPADILPCSAPYRCSAACFAAEFDHMDFVQAMLVVLLPTSFFFVFLYYTDMGALTFFLAAYWVRAPRFPLPA